ncbi:hypothetical protein Ae706Ps2_6406 [Pseudonocardia sp. Ae706_Ps2]|nr:hypothetical protein Ae706Ps2_6406 [Pseudonocardia sp. Ae706_Ps2]
MDADTLRYLGDCSAGIEDKTDGLVLILLGEMAACHHAIPSAAISGSLRPVSTRSGTVQS